MAKELTLDDQVLDLRDKGRSFVAIAKELELSDAREAIAAFNRAFDQRNASDQKALRKREGARLDALGERLRGRDDLSEEEIDRRMRGLQRLRKALRIA